MANLKQYGRKYMDVYERRLRVSRRAYGRIDDFVFFFPEIRLTGRWVEECGFRTGDRIVVSVQPNLMIIEKETGCEEELAKMVKERERVKAKAWKRWKRVFFTELPT
ncbi:SymE family type I addiction module toxin [Elizabethkingia meningoseptica]|uniref:SymE family type I addiction module toxin n=1 Tax=Elizabethkingia meningoseptica TaxID=238 RepID=UPI002DD65880|nr:SymE family type I addiction module toxin [Elizabethkingia meningoseptica]MEC4712396.1 SymE family type I addiction module toxin [Elizabethkingia meningoseptica]